MVEDCECDNGFFINPKLKRCVPNPTVGQPGYIADCKVYNYDGEDGEDAPDGELICDECMDGETHVIDTATNTCVAHNLTGC